MDLWMNMLPMVAAVTVAATSTSLATYVEEFTVKEYNSSEVVDNLRRQLMKDNYDYLLEASTERPYRYHAESDDSEPPTEVVRLRTALTLETPIDFYTKVTTSNIMRTTVDLRDLRRNPMYDQRSKYVAPNEHKKLATSGADKILYAEDNIAHRQNERFTLPEPAAADNRKQSRIGEHRRNDAADTTVKYTLLKVGSTRRIGRRTHLVKEEKSGEVSIVNLGDGAVPQFQLPRPRAQYMRDSDPESDRDVPHKARAPIEPLPAIDLD